MVYFRKLYTPIIYINLRVLNIKLKKKIKNKNIHIVVSIYIDKVVSLFCTYRNFRLNRVKFYNSYKGSLRWLLSLKRIFLTPTIFIYIYTYTFINITEVNKTKR